MKRILSITCLAAILLCCSIPAFASAMPDAPNSTAPISEKQPSNVTITVVMPDPAPAIEPKSTESALPQALMFPSDVTETVENGVRRVIKTYELTETENPEDIPREAFERGGYRYELTDVLRRETANAETREHVEVVTVNTDTKELEKILPLLAPTMEYTAEDGFVGILTLDVTSIKVETAGTKTSSYTMTVTREYPRLSANDTSLVPKTVEDKGKTYTLAGVDWRVGNYATVDYEQVAEYYTAVATYTATGSSTKVTGYTTTVAYNGTLAKLTQGKTFYTAYFEGEEIRTPLEMTEQTPAAMPTDTDASVEHEHDADTAESTATSAEPDATASASAPSAPSDSDGSAKNNNYTWLAVIPCIAAAAGGAYYFIKKRKAAKSI